jgi:hypothetical protein
MTCQVIRNKHLHANIEVEGAGGHCNAKSLSVTKQLIFTKLDLKDLT